MQEVPGTEMHSSHASRLKGGGYCTTVLTVQWLLLQAWLVNRRRCGVWGNLWRTLHLRERCACHCTDIYPMLVHAHKRVLRAVSLVERKVKRKGVKGVCPNTFLRISLKP